MHSVGQQWIWHESGVPCHWVSGQRPGTQNESTPMNLKMLCVHVLSVAATTSVHAVDFTNIGVMAGDSSVSVGGVSADGTVVVGTSWRSDGWETAFKWTRNGGLEGLYGNGIGSTSAAAVSADGATVVGYIPNRAAMWSSAGGVQNLGVLTDYVSYQGPPHVLSAASCVSADGSVVAGFSRATSNEKMFIWSSATGQMSSPTSIPDSSNTDAELISGLSADGLVFVGYNASIRRAFRSANGTTNALTRPNGSYGFGSYGRNEALGVSSNGLVVVGWSEVLLSSGEAWRWAADTQMVALGHLTGETKSLAYSANWDGSLIVGKSGNRAFVWSQVNGMVDLQSYLTALGIDLTGWNLEIAQAISADGTAIAGSGTFNGAQRAFVVSDFVLAPPIDPCPGDITGGGFVDATDLSILLALWGSTGGGEFDADVNNDGIVEGADLSIVLGGWGPCPN